MAAVFSPQVFENTPGLLLDPYLLKYNSRKAMHYHDCVEIGLCTKGSGVCFVQNKIIPFVQGQLTFMNAGEAHIFQSHASQPSSWLFLYIAPQLTENMSLPDNGVYQNRNAETIIHVLWDLMQKGGYCADSVTHLCSALPGIIGNSASHTASLELNQKREKILPAIEYISHNYQEKLNIKKLADICFLSESFFRRCFREAMNDSPHTYLNRVRLAFADSLLLSADVSIVEVSHASGFESLSSFNRCFRKYHNMSPREYRAKYSAE